MPRKPHKTACDFCQGTLEHGSIRQGERTACYKPTCHDALVKWLVADNPFVHCLHYADEKGPKDCTCPAGCACRVEGPCQEKGAFESAEDEDAESDAA